MTKPALSLPLIYGSRPPELELGPLATARFEAQAAIPQGPARDSTASHRQLVEAGRQFESYFISYLLKVMRETVHEGALHNKFGAYFHSFYDEEIGLRAADAGGIGIARMIQEYADKNLSLPGPRAQVLPGERR